MTTPDNPDSSEANPADSNGAAGSGAPAPQPGDTPESHADVAPAPQDPVTAEDTAIIGVVGSADAPSGDEAAAGHTAGADAAPPGEQTHSEAGNPPAGTAADRADSAAANGTGASWVSTSAPPWQRTGGPTAPSLDQPTVTIRLDGEGKPGGTAGVAEEPRKKFSGAYGYTEGVGPGRSDASKRYGHTVSQSTSGRTGPGAGQDSQPTVRIGGYVHSDRPAPAPTASPPPSAASRIRATPRIPRRASLQLRYLEPWSVLKISLVLSVAGFLAWMVAVGILYGVLEGMGVWDQLNGTYSDLTSVNNPEAGAPLISAAGVFGVATLIGLVNVVLITAMCTVGSFIYNVSADLAGGIEVTLSERD